ncbi:MAG: SGNH/GDSL hydrolase family protein [Candidatus Methylacidiphilales bacterium]
MSPFPDNARYVAIGDSITQSGFYLPYIDLYYITRFPQNKVKMFNAGINGDTAEGGLKRHSWDVAPHGPTVASIAFGMNDVGRDCYAAGKDGAEVEKRRRGCLESYENNLRNLVARLQDDKVSVVLLTPTIFDNVAPVAGAHLPGLNEALAECAQIVRKIGAETGCPVVDFYGPMLSVTEKRQAADPAFTMIGTDRVHPTQLGQLFMAYLFLKAQNVPAEVARVVIASATVKEASNCVVNEVKAEGGGLTFRYTAGSLPFPIEKWTSAATTWAPFVADLNQETLQVTDLTAGTYQLMIDDKPVRTYTSEELAAGVNLATEEKTPQRRQAQKVWDTYKLRQEMVAKLRTIACVERSAFAPDEPRKVTVAEMEPLLEAYLHKMEGMPWQAGIEKEVQAYRLCKSDEANLLTKCDAMMDDIRKLAQPVPRVVKLVPVAAAPGTVTK